MRDIRHSDEGQALVEFALVVPILLILLVGIVDLARAYERWNEQTSYANTAARYVAVGQPATSPSRPPPAGACVAVSLPAGTYATGDPVKVDVRSTYTYLPFVAANSGVGSAIVNGSATSRIETAPASDPTTSCP